MRLAEGLRRAPESEPSPTLVVAVTLPAPLDDDAGERLLGWLRVRTGFPDVALAVTAPEGRRR